MGSVVHMIIHSRCNGTPTLQKKTLEKSLEVKGCTGSTFVLRDASQGGSSLRTKGSFNNIPWSQGKLPLEMNPLARRLTLCIP